MGFLLASGLVCDTMGQEYQVRSWSKDDGLISSAISALAETREGYLWIGTPEGALLRFDGVRFTNMESMEGLEALRPPVRQLFEDSEGALWIASGSQLYRLHRGFATLEWAHSGQETVDGILSADAERLVFRLDDGRLLIGVQEANGSRKWEVIDPPFRSHLNFHCRDGRGAIWYLRADGKLGRWLDGRFSEIPALDGLAGTRINVLMAGLDQRIWIGTDRELAVWDGAKFAAVPLPGGEAALDVSRVVFASDGALWVYANKRLRRFDGKRWGAEARLAGEDDPRKLPKNVQPDAEGGFWIPPHDETGLVHVCRDGTVELVTVADGLPSPDMPMILSDRQHNIWVASRHRASLARVRKSLFQTIGKPEGLLDPELTSVCQDGQGGIFMGTHGNSVARWHEGVCTNFTVPELGGFGDSPVVSADALGRVWIAGETQGILVFENGRFSSAVSPDQRRRAQVSMVRTILPGRDGGIWIATLGRVFRLQDGKLTQIYAALQSAKDNPVALAEGPDGGLWIATQNGRLLRHASGEFKAFSPPGGPFRFASLWADPDGSVWLGTYGGGLLHFLDGKFTRFTAPPKLPSDTIATILGDGGDLWLGTNIGIVRLSKDELLRSKPDGRVAYRLFDRNDGMRSAAVTFDFQPAAWRSREGRLWFATNNGAVGILPAEIPKEDSPPPVVMEELLADGAPQTIPPAGGLKIGPGAANLDFVYSGLNLSAPESIGFRYKLEGLENAWTYAGSSRLARYRHLLPGRYVFHVQACNSDGVWNAKGATVSFQVQPFFWQTLWFRAGVTFLVAAGVLALARGYIRSRERRRTAALQRQAAIYNERLRIARDIHDVIGSRLTQIAFQGESLRLLAGIGPDVASGIDKISSASRQIVGGLDEIVWATDPDQDTLESIADYLGAYAGQFFQGTGVSCRLDLPTSLVDRSSPEVRHQVFLAFKEALHNAARHSGATEVLVKMEVDAGICTVLVQDNGRGFDLPTVQSSQRSIGGHGLNNLQNRMAAIGGSCEIASKPGCGTSIRLIWKRTS